MLWSRGSVEVAQRPHASSIWSRCASQEREKDGSVGAKKKNHRDDDP